MVQLKWWNRLYHWIGRTSMRPYGFGSPILIHLAKVCHATTVTKGVASRQLSVRLNFDRLSCRVSAARLSARRTSEVLSKFRVKRF